MESSRQFHCATVNGVKEFPKSVCLTLGAINRFFVKFPLTGLWYIYEQSTLEAKESISVRWKPSMCTVKSLKLGYTLMSQTTAKPLPTPMLAYHPVDPHRLLHVLNEVLCQIKGRFVFQKGILKLSYICTMSSIFCLSLSVNQPTADLIFWVNKKTSIHGCHNNCSLAGCYGEWRALAGCYGEWQVSVRSPVWRNHRNPFLIINQIHKCTQMTHTFFVTY